MAKRNGGQFLDIRDLVRFGNLEAAVVELNNGDLIAVPSNGNFDTISKSIDQGANWTTKYTWPTGNFIGRCLFKDSRGYLYVGTTRSSSFAQLIRSTDNGENWGVVCTFESNSSWRMCEDSLGYVYVAEYSVGNGDANEKYGYNIWRSTNEGLTWTKFHSEPAQSSPGAKDGIRHTHMVACDSEDNLYCSFGDSSYGGNKSKTFRLNRDGSLGDLISSEGNGWIGMAQADNGSIFFGDDIIPGGMFQYYPDSNTYTRPFLTAQRFGSEFDGYIYELNKGRDGVLYGLSDALTNMQPNIYASPDDGVTWIMLRFITEPRNMISVLRVNPIGTNKRVYVALKGKGFASFPDFTRRELLSRTALGTVNSIPM